MRRCEVALKLLPAGAEPAEFRILRQLGHPGVVRVLDVGRSPSGEPWFTMDLVEGRPFGRAGAQAVDTALRRIAMLLDSVAVLHDRGWVHGDLKPDNVLVREDGRPVLIDFGLALSDRDTDRGLRGTLGWIAPEVLAGRDASAASDLYAVGVLAHGELTGGEPFEVDRPDPGLQPTEGLSLDLDDARAEALQGWLAALLRADPALRPGSARAALASLEALAAQTLVPPQDRRAQLGPTRPFRREHLIERAVRALRDGALVFVVGGDGSGRSTVLRDIDDRLRAGGVQTTGLVLSGGPARARRSVETFLADRGVPLPRRSAVAGGDSKQASEAWQQAGTELRLHLQDAVAGMDCLLVDDLDAQSLVGGSTLDALGWADIGAAVAVAPDGEAAAREAVAARDGGAALVLELDPLGVDDVTGWLRAALGPVRPLRRLARWLVEATGGVPGRLREATSTLLEEGLLQRGEAEWYCDMEAVQAQAAALAVRGELAPDLLARAAEALSAGDRRLATHLTRAAVEEGLGDRANLLVQLGELLVGTGDPAGAAEAFAQSRALRPDPTLVLREAEARMHAGNIDAALALLDDTPDAGDPAPRARLAASALLRGGRYAEAQAAQESYAASATTPIDRVWAASIAANIAIVQGRGADAEGIVRAALDQIPPSLDAGVVATLQVALGNALRLSGRLDEASEPYEDALIGLKKVGRLMDAARVANNLGILRYQQGDPLGAVAAWEEFREHARRGGVRLEYFNALNNLGCVYRDTGDAARAMATLQEALDIAKTDAPTGVPVVLGNLAEATGVSGQVDRADELFRECIAAARAQENAAEEAEAWRRMVQLRLDNGNLDDLAPMIEKARGVANEANVGLELLLLRGLARALAIRDGEDSEALDEGLSVADDLDEAGLRFEADRLRLRLVEALAERERLEEAELRLDELEASLRKVSARPELARVDAVRRTIREATRFHLQDISRHYDALQDLTLALSRERDLHRLLDLILQRALDLVGEDRGYVLLVNDEGLPIQTASRKVGSETIDDDLAPSRSVTRRVMETRRPLVVLDVDKEDSLRRRQSVLAAGLRSVICVPILRGDDLLGLIYVDGQAAVSGAAERKASLLMACADAASVAIENARLIRALQEKNDALAIMAHELRTPIGAIIGFVSEVMGGETESPDEDLELMGLVKSEAERVSHMVQEVLDMARTEAHRLEWRRDPVDPLELVLASTDTLRPLAKQAEVTLIRDADDDVPEFEGDRDRMVQVLVNLVGNAIKFSPPGGTIRVHAECSDDGVCIFVEDEGPGVPEDRLESIFEAYEQAGPAGQREKGVGLGLAVAREIVTRHRGRLWAENRTEAGARFLVWLPALDGAGLSL